MELIGNALTTITTVVTIASLIAASTPTPIDDNWIKKIYGYIDMLALNIGRAKDK